VVAGGVVAARFPAPGVPLEHAVIVEAIDASTNGIKERTNIVIEANLLCGECSCTGLN
jgi:hypothetical protein